MNIHEFKYFSANVVKLLKFNITKQLDVLIAPVKLSLIIHGFCFS